MSLDTRVYRKPSASDLYLLPSSAHPTSTRRGLIKGERVRYLRLSSSKGNFDRAWNRFRTALLYRGYPKEEIAKVEEELTWEGRESERQKLRERAEEKKERRRGKEGWGKKGACPGIPIVLPSKPGVQQWWEQSMRGSLVELGGLGEEELKRLQPRSRMVKCMSRTPTLGNIF